jgi:hypothetical protein
MTLHAKTAFLGKSEFRWRGQQWPVTLQKDEAEAIIEKNDKYWLDAENQKAKDDTDGKQGVAEANPMDLSHGSGAKLKQSSEYRRDVKDNKQINSQRKASNVRVQKGYSYYDNKHNVNEGSLDEIHDIVSRMMDKHISKYRSGLIDPDHLMSIISKAAQVIGTKYNIPQRAAEKLISDYVEDAAVKQDEIANQNYRADTMSESEIREEQLLATDLKRQLELFKRGKDQELGKKPKDAEIQKKRQEK